MPGEAILLREWQTVGPDEDTRLARSEPLTAEEAAFAAELGRAGRLEILEVRGGLRVTTRSYVGLVRLGPITLQIQPKLADFSPTAMATFLRYALGVRMVSTWGQAVCTPLETNGLTDLIALSLLEEVNALLHSGILQGYEIHADWRPSPRGRLDIRELAQNSMRAQTTPAIPCRVSERVADTPLNRLVLAALEATRLLVLDSGIAFDLHSRSAVLGELCRKVPLTQAVLDAAAAAIDRRSWHYQPILAIAALILQGLGVTVGDTERRAVVSSFLVDMNLLFERFVSRLLVEHTPPGIRVAIQVEHGSAYQWRENPYQWQHPRLRPDIVLYDTASGEPRIILDAKYKPLSASRRPSPEDLYQLTLYSLSFGSQYHVPARIVFPEVLDQTTSRVPHLNFQGWFGLSAMASVSFHPLPLLSLTSALQSQDTPALEQMVRSLTHVS